MIGGRAEQTDQIHSPAFGTLLKERMDAAGVECALRFSTDYQTSGDAEHDLLRF